MWVERGVLNLRTAFPKRSNAQIEHRGWERDRAELTLAKAEAEGRLAGVTAELEAQQVVNRDLVRRTARGPCLLTRGPRPRVRSGACLQVGRYTFPLGKASYWVFFDLGGEAPRERAFFYCRPVERSLPV